MYYNPGRLLTSTGGSQRSLWRLWLNDNKLFVVGSKSPFATHKPDTVEPVYKPKKKA